MGILLEGLSRAKDDQKILNDTSFDKNFGPCLYNKFYEHFPMFFTRFGSEINLIGQYHGASVFFICNGPSLASGKYDLTLLKRPGVVTYGINNGPRTIRPNFWSCVDSPERFLKSTWLDPSIAKFVPFTFSEKSIFDNEQWKTSNVKVQDCPNVIYFRRNEKFVANRWLKELTINWGNSKDNGGGRSVMLASLKVMFLLGFRNVFLMGADFKMSKDYTYHFDEQRADGAVKGNMDTYQKLSTQYFPQLKPHFEAEGFKVYNCNKESELKVFDYVPFEDAIAFATKPLGNVDSERTWGMYSKPEDRQNWLKEPDENSKPHLKNIVIGNRSPVYMDVKSPSTIGKESSNMRDKSQQPMQPNIAVQNDTIEDEFCEDNDANNENTNNENVNKNVVPAGEMKIANLFKKDELEKVKKIEQRLQQSPKQTPKQPTQQTSTKNDQTRIVRSVPCGGGISTSKIG